MPLEPDIIRDGELEYRRLKKKVREYIKKNLKDYVYDDSVVGRKGKKLVRVPITGVRLPSFERDRNKSGGVGQGGGQPGDPLPGQGQPGQPGAGGEAGEHAFETEIMVDDLLELLQEALELPNIQEKGKRKITSKDIEFTDLRRVGPECLLDVKRTLKNALFRILANAPDSMNECPPIIIEPDDRVFKTWEEKVHESTNAVVFSILDISGSMGAEQKKIVATTMFWIEQWLKKEYKEAVEIVHIVHDTTAWEVTADEFYRVTEGGGTAISSALKLMDKIIDEKYPASEWNIYPFFFSDGDNKEEDDADVINVLQNAIIPKANQICYGQVQNAWANGGMYKLLLDKLGGCEKLCVYELKRMDDVMGAIKKFLGRGR